MLLLHNEPVGLQVDVVPIEPMCPKIPHESIIACVIDAFAPLAQCIYIGINGIGQLITPNKLQCLLPETIPELAQIVGHVQSVNHTTCLRCAICSIFVLSII